MKHRNRISIARARLFAVALIFASALGLTQILEPPRPPSVFFPQGAQVYIESKDLREILEWWVESEIRKNWEKTPNYAQFTSSRLYLKLKDRLSRFGAGGKFQFRLENLIAASGKRSAIALYNIGDLKALSATQISETDAFACELWMAKERFEKKSLDQQTYYVEPGEGILSFAYARPYLLAATDEELLRKTLLAMGSAGGLDQSDVWQKASSRKDQDADVSLFLNMTALNESRHFKRYWIHRNLPDLKNIQSVWIDLKITDNELTEHRWIVRDQQIASATGISVDEYLNAFQQFPYETVALEQQPAPPDAANQILGLINKLPDRVEETSFPPEYTAAHLTATSAEQKNLYLQRIDEELPNPKDEKWIEANQSIEISRQLEAGKLLAQMKFSYPVWDDQALFMRISDSVLLQFENPNALNREELLKTILRHYLLLHSTQELGARWKETSENEYTLEALYPVFVKFQKNWILISNRNHDLQQLNSLLPDYTQGPAASYSAVRWSNARWKYSRLMRRLDHRLFQDGQVLFFSESVNSLLSVLPFEQSSIESTGEEETVRYVLQK